MKSTTIRILIALGLGGSGMCLYAQQQPVCGEMPHTVIMTCTLNNDQCDADQEVQASSDSGGPYSVEYTFRTCPGTSCSVAYYKAGDPCVSGNLRNPEIAAQLRSLSRHLPLLVASCGGGLVEYPSSGRRSPEIQELLDQVEPILYYKRTLE